jgi:hypothetical protein
MENVRRGVARRRSVCYSGRRAGHRYGHRIREGRAGRGAPRRDRHVSQRNARHSSVARCHHGHRGLRVPERSSRHLHGRSHDERVQDDAAQGRGRQSRRPARHPDAHARGRRRDGNRGRQGRYARDSGAERRAVVHRRHRLGPEPPDREPQLHGARVARPRRHRHEPDRRRVLDGRRQQPRDDGRRVDDGYRQQPAARRAIRPSTAARAAFRSRP